MTSVGIAASTTMQTWMVDMLFAQPGQDKPGTPTAASMAVPAISVASAAKSAVVPVTGQAIAALQAGGANMASDAGSEVSHYMTVAQSNALVASNNALTSAQISSALYSGGGLQGLGTGETETFATMMQFGRDNAQTYLDLANDPVAVALMGLDPDSFRAAAAFSNAMSDSIQKAFDNHTLVIQKLSDVPGLNFSQRETFLGPSENSQPTGVVWTGNCDEHAIGDFMSQFKDGKHGATPFVGGVELLVTWTDDDLK